MTRQLAKAVTANGRARPRAARRREHIVLEIARHGYVSGSNLARTLGVSEMTIRRDLEHLEALGKLQRSHGGAIARRTLRLDVVEPDVALRSQRNAREKARIAATATTMVAPRQLVALDIGSTTLCLAQALIGRNVRFFTCSLKIATLLAGAGETVLTPGGTVHGTEPSVVGAMARRHIEAFTFDLVFVAVSGISGSGLHDYSLEDSEIKRALIERASHVVALVDSSKFERLSVAKVCDLDAVDALVSDAAPDPPLRAALERAGVSLVIADNQES